jgi:hypothetical protein
MIEKPWIMFGWLLLAFVASLALYVTLQSNYSSDRAKAYQACVQHQKDASKCPSLLP